MKVTLTGAEVVAAIADYALRRAPLVDGEYKCGVAGPAMLMTVLGAKNPLVTVELTPCKQEAGES